MKIRNGSYSLLAQLVIGFASLAIFTTIMVGLPAVLLLNQALVRQAWNQTEAGGNTTIAMLDAMQMEIQQVAVLTAQRPSLENFVRAGDDSHLKNYIRTLQTGANSSLVMVCDQQGRQLASASTAAIPDLCKMGTLDKLFLDPSGSQPSLWMIAARDFPEEGSRLGRVLIGQRMDQPALSKLALQTGMGLLIMKDNQVFASSLPGSVTIAPYQPQPLSFPFKTAMFVPGGQRVSIELDEEPYFGIRFPYHLPGIQLVVMLPVTQMVQQQSSYERYFLAGLLLTVIVSTLLGWLAARAIIHPLSRIREAARDLRKGVLTTAIPRDTPVREIYEVASILEESRTTLQHTLTEYDLQRTRIEHLMESIVEGIVTLDHRGRITFFSQGAERISGWRQSDALGRHCDDVFHLEEEGARFSDSIPAPGLLRKVNLRLATGRIVALSVSGTKLTQSESSREASALVLRDVSDQERLTRLLGDFLANITHEFRTPLSALAASTELLHDQLPDLGPDEIDELLISIRLGIIGLQTLIDNLLEGASIETGQFKVFPKPVQATEIIYETVLLLQPLLLKYHQNLHIDIPFEYLTVMADVRRTVQVLVNLLSNAIKNNPEGGEITISVAIENDYACIRVEDQGPGIRGGQTSDIFNRFTRFETTGDRSQAGAGLGLSVVKTIVEAQGGQVGAQNQPEGGAVFFFTLPVIQEME